MAGIKVTDTSLIHLLVGIIFQFVETAPFQSCEALYLVCCSQKTSSLNRTLSYWPVSAVRHDLGFDQPQHGDGSTRGRRGQCGAHF